MGIQAILNLPRPPAILSFLERNTPVEPQPVKPIVAVLSCIAATTILGCQPAPAPSRPSKPSLTATTHPTPTTAPAMLTNQPTSNSPAVAMVNGHPITLEQLQRPLIDAYGLSVLLNLVQLDLAKQEAAAAKVTVTPADIEQERQMTIAKMFQDADKKDYERLLEQFLSQQHVSRPEFDLVMQTNAYLRKIAEPLLKDKITEESLQQAYRTLYGENVQVRDIEVANLQEIAAVQRRLAAGDSFDKVAREMSRDPRTKPDGGLLPPFSREITNLSPAFKDAAFALQNPGDISDPIQTGDSFHLIQLVRKIEPKAVKFEDVKDSVRTELYDRLMQATIAQLRREIARTAVQTMDIRDPVLKRQFQEKQEQQAATIRDRDRVRQQDLQQRKELSERQTLPATAPSATEARERPPATKSGQ